MARKSEKILQQLRGYESFLGSLRTICDMGSGTGDDITWWAQLTSLDEEIPYNYRCFAVDNNETNLNKIPNLENITKIHRDFTQPYIIPTNIDLLWSHDSLQYSINPIDTLKNWNEQMTSFEHHLFESWQLAQRNSGKFVALRFKMYREENRGVIEERWDDCP